MASAWDELGEIVTYLRHTYRRGNKLDKKDFLDRVTPETPPILLIHGFLGTRGAMFPLELRLRRDGFVVFSVNLGVFNIGDIRRSALKIHREIQRILREVDIEKIDIIAHSMGGLIGMYYLKRLHGAAYVRKMITLGTPHHGTWLSLLGIGLMGLVSPSTWQLVPDNFFLKELYADPLPPGVSFYSIAGSQDWVCPPERCHLEGARNILISWGHAGLATSQAIYRILRDILLQSPLSNHEDLILSSEGDDDLDKGLETGETSPPRP